ncbi:MAG TPA: Rad52/Rad22 family DNA repair protein, partial [Pyrinomonadaceae bacterium]|nr:Rad52/Rad22 family DNA repair protein [Pyrinomonadaceae bacterium]
RGEAAPQAQGATPDSRTAERPDTTTQPASEKHGEAAAAVKAPRKTPRFVREQNEQPEVEATTKDEIVAAETQERSLADNEETEELEMTKKATAHKPADEQEFITAEEYEEQSVAPVVPLSFAKTLSTLKQPVDPRLIKTREGWRDRNGNQHMVEYVEWHTVADILDRVAPTWSHSVRGIVQIGDMVAVTCAITIDGVTREGVGTGTADNETGIKKAEHDALKRAAIKFGIARELYQRESEVIEREGAGPQPGDFPKDPLAKSMADLVTPKQLGMIRALAREAGVDPDEESQQVMRVRTEELSKRAASSFIDHLKGLQNQTFEVRRAS